MKTGVALVIAVIAASLIAWNWGALNAAEETPENLEQRIDQSSTATQAEMLEHVPKIVKLEYKIQESDPPSLVVTAYGEVPTAGWKQVQLLRRIYVKPPSNGIWEYDLLAQRPGGMAAQVISYVKATNTWSEYDESIQGIRVYGVGEGVHEVKFDEAK